jgi:hypothetical protein
VQLTGGEQDSLRRTARDELAFDTWYHVACTYDGSRQQSGLQLFVDGVPAANPSEAAVAADAAAALAADAAGPVNTSLAVRIGAVTFVGGATSAAAGANGAVTLLSCVPPSPSPSGSATATASLSRGASASQTSTRTATGSGTPSGTPTRTVASSVTPTATRAAVLPLGAQLNVSIGTIIGASWAAPAGRGIWAPSPSARPRRAATRGEAGLSRRRPPTRSPAAPGRTKKVSISSCSSSVCFSICTFVLAKQEN